MTFPMLPEARVRAEDAPFSSGPEADLARALAESFREARQLLA